MALESHRDGLPGGERRVEEGLLKGAAEPGPGPLVGGPSGDVAAPELDGAAVDGQEPGDAVEERRLAGAVLADEAEDLALPEFEVDAVDGVDAAEALDDSVAGKQDGRVGGSGRRR